MAKAKKNKSGRWEIRITVNGEREFKTFSTKSQAEAWAAKKRVDAEDRSLGRLPKVTIRELLERFDKEVSGKKPDGKDSTRLNNFYKDPICDILNVDIIGDDVNDWAQRRLQDVSGATVNREWNLLSSVFSRAVKQWKLMRHNPCSDAQRPPDGEARKRRPTDDELDAVLNVLGWDEHQPETVSQRIAAAALFSVETAMRAGEICTLEWHEVYERHLHIPKHKAKNRHERDVPLSSRARELIKLLPKETSFVFNLNNSSRDTLWRKAARKAGIEDLHFHDLRREALSRMAKKVDVMTLAKISGHREVKTLLQVYYAPQMSDMADLLD